MQFMFWLFNLVASILGSILLLRAYLWSLAISPRDPMVRFAWKFTDWLVNPIAYVVRPRGDWDWSSLAAALLVASVSTLLAREVTGFPATALSLSIAPFALVLRWAVDLLTWCLVFYCVMSFFSNPLSPYMGLLSTLVDPILRPVRRIVPTFGRFDLSPVVLFVILSALQGFVIAPASAGVFIF